MKKKPTGTEKTAALREAGALNPHLESVTDGTFRSDAFFDARDIVQVKYEMLRRVNKDGQTVTQAAQGFGFSRPAFYQALHAFQKNGLPGLLPQRRGPHGPHKLGGEVLDFLEQAAKDDPSLGARDLAELAKERFGLSLHPRSIERGLARKKKPGGKRPQ